MLGELWDGDGFEYVLSCGVTKLQAREMRCCGDVFLADCAGDHLMQLVCASGIRGASSPWFSVNFPAFFAVISRGFVGIFGLWNGGLRGEFGGDRVAARAGILAKDWGAFFAWSLWFWLRSTVAVLFSARVRAWSVLLVELIWELVFRFWFPLVRRMLWNGVDTGSVFLLRWLISPGVLELNWSLGGRVRNFREFVWGELRGHCVDLNRDDKMGRVQCLWVPIFREW